MLMRAARRDGIIVDDPCEFLDSVKRGTASVKRRAFAEKELQAVLSVCDGEWRSLVLFGLYTGQRLGDLARLTWSNIDLVRNELRLVVSKTGKTLILPLAPALRAHIEASPSADNLQAPLHPKAAAFTNTSTLSNQFSDLLAQAGLSTKRAHRICSGQGRSSRRTLGELSFHSLRHTTVSMLHAAGLPQAIVLAYAGHASAKINALYTHVGLDALEKAAQALPQL
jgi:integrase